MSCRTARLFSDACSASLRSTTFGSGLRRPAERCSLFTLRSMSYR